MTKTYLGMKNRNGNITPNVKSGVTAKKAADGGTRRNMSTPAAGIMASMVGIVRSRRQVPPRRKATAAATKVRKNSAAGRTTGIFTLSKDLSFKWGYHDLTLIITILPAKNNLSLI